MASTLITRLTNPDLLTAEERDAVDAEVPEAAAEWYRLPVEPVTAVAQEIIEGRLPSTVMLEWITAAEKVDADALVALVQAGTWTLDRIERLLTMGVRGHYTPAQIVTIIGLEGQQPLLPLG